MHSVVQKNISFINAMYIINEKKNRKNKFKFTTFFFLFKIAVKSNLKLFTYASFTLSIYVITKSLNV